MKLGADFMTTIEIPHTSRSRSHNTTKSIDLLETQSKISKQSAIKDAVTYKGNKVQKVMFNKKEMIEKKRKKELAIKQK